jgi:hypothetical protein
MHHLERKIRLLQYEVRRLDHGNPLLRNSRVSPHCLALTSHTSGG